MNETDERGAFEIAGDPSVPGCPPVQTFSDPGPMQSYLMGVDAGVRCDEPEYAAHVVAKNRHAMKVRLH